MVGDDCWWCMSSVHIAVICEGPAVGDDCLWCMSIVRIAVMCEGPVCLVMIVGGACQVCAHSSPLGLVSAGLLSLM